MQNYWRRMYQEGGALLQPTEEDVIGQITQLVQDALQGIPEAQEQIQQIASAAEQGDSDASQMLEMISEIAKALAGEESEEDIEAKRHGGLLNYFYKLKCGGKAKARRPVKRGRGGCVPCKKKMFHRVGGVIVETCAD